MGKILFITGTDTGVGKTVLTGLLVRHLRNLGLDARAMKPFCSGSMADVRFLRAAQDDALSAGEINPYFFDKPLAPAAMPSSKTRGIRLDSVVKKIKAVAVRCEVLLVEGSGGVLVPLSEKYTVLDLISALKCPVLVASRNQLGTINHTLLTLKTLQAAGVEKVVVAMTAMIRPDLSSSRNVEMVQKWGGVDGVFEVPSLGLKANFTREIKNNAKKMKKTLARIMNHDNFVLVLRGDPKKDVKRKN